MNDQKPRIIVSAIIEKEINGQKHIFVQTRHKPASSPAYLNTLEIPAGGIEPYENVFEAVKREVYEETGLTVISINGQEYNRIFENRPGDKSLAFYPFLCQQVLETKGGLPWYGFVFICQVKGEVRINKKEAKDPRWISINDLKKLMTDKPEKIFPLQYATLLYYIKNNK